jgi:hypothetical protein
MTYSRCQAQGMGNTVQSIIVFTYWRKIREQAKWVSLNAEQEDTCVLLSQQNEWNVTRKRAGSYAHVRQIRCLKFCLPHWSWCSFIAGINSLLCRSQWPRGLRHELSSLARTLGSWVQIRPKAWPAFRLGLGCSVCRYGLATSWSPIRGVLPTVHRI